MGAGDQTAGDRPSTFTKRGKGNENGDHSENS